MSKVELTTKQIKQLTEYNYCIVVGRNKLSNLLTGIYPCACWVDESGNRTDIYNYEIKGNHPTINVLFFEGYAKDCWFKNCVECSRLDYETQKYYDSMALRYAKHYNTVWDARKEIEYLVHDLIYECFNNKIVIKN